MANTIEDKIKNGLFVWGNNTINQGTDLASLVISQAFVNGVKGGDLIEASVLNSALRGGSLVSYSIIEALKLGPQGSQTGDPTWNANLQDIDPASWWQNLPDAEYHFDYDLVNVNLPNFCSNLRRVANEYLKGASVYQSIKANVWTTGRSFTILDATGVHSGTPTTGVNGSTNVDIKLPGTIDADVTGSSSNVTSQINGKSISSIFESNGIRVKEATGATKLSTISDTSGSTVYKLMFKSGASGFQQVYTGDIEWTPATKTLGVSNITAAKTRTQNLYVPLALCSTGGSVAAKTASFIQFGNNFVLEWGARVLVKMENANQVNSSTVTLNIGNTGAKKILVNGSTVQGLAWTTGETIELYYDDTADSNNGAYVMVNRQKRVETATSADKVANSLSISLNGTTNTYNGSTAKSLTLYAPTSAGTNGYVLTSNGSGAPSWTNQSSLKAGKLCDTSGNYLNKGTKSRPVYFLNGEPTICSYWAVHDSFMVGASQSQITYQNITGIIPAESGWVGAQGIRFSYSGHVLGGSAYIGLNLVRESGNIFTRNDDTIRISLYYLYKEVLKFTSASGYNIQKVHCSATVLGDNASYGDDICKVWIDNSYLYLCLNSYTNGKGISAIIVVDAPTPQ